MNAGNHRTRSCGDSGRCSHLGLRLTWSLNLTLTHPYLSGVCPTWCWLCCSRPRPLPPWLLCPGYWPPQSQVRVFVKLCILFWFPRWQVDMGTWLDWVSCFKKLFLEWGIRSFFSSGRSLQKAFALPFKAAGQFYERKRDTRLPKNICNLLQTCILIAKPS